MNQDDLGRRIAQRLDDDLGTIPPAVLERLHAARQQALRRVGSRSSPTIQISAWIARLGSRTLFARALAAVVFVAVVGAGLLYWQLSSQHQSIDVETAILADELPIHAYTDPGFQTWLRHSSHDQSRQ